MYIKIKIKIKEYKKKYRKIRSKFWMHIENKIN